VAPIITGIILHFRFHILCISLRKLLYFSVLCYYYYYSDDKIEKNEMGGACNAHGGEERRTQGFGGET
jgi:hypothetical protein